MQPIDLPGFTVLEVLGRGGMGLVVKARDLALDRIVAIKLINARAGERALARFRREARVLAELRHPNIVRVHDAGQHEGRPYMIMEAIRGLSLERRVLGALRGGVPMPAEIIARRIREVAEALVYCHARGVVHRDVKPGNIMIDREDERERAVLIDFGALKGALVGSEARLEGLSQRLSASGDIIGTPAFMAPEQLDARLGYGEAGPACDAWALGATLFFAFAAEPPFAAASNLAMVHALLEGEPRDLRALAPSAPSWIAALCRSCLRRDPDERPTMSALAESLESGRFPAAPKRPSQRGRTLGLGLTGAAAGLAVLATLAWPEPSLRDALADPTARARAAAMIQGRPPQQGLATLLSLLDDDDAGVAQRAAELIVEVPGAALALVGAMAKARGRRLARVSAALSGLGEAARPALGPLAALAARSGPERKRAAAEVLAALGRGGLDPEARGRDLAGLIDGAREEEALAILALLAAMGAPGDRALLDIEPRGRPEELARAIGEAQERLRSRDRVRAANSHVIGEMIRAYADPKSSRRERVFARSVLSEWGALALPQLLEALSEASEPRSLKLLELVELLGPKASAARPELEALAATSPSQAVRAAAQKILDR